MSSHSDPPVPPKPPHLAGLSLDAIRTFSRPALELDLSLLTEREANRLGDLKRKLLRSRDSFLLGLTYDAHIHLMEDDISFYKEWQKSAAMTIATESTTDANREARDLLEGDRRMVTTTLLQLQDTVNVAERKRHTALQDLHEAARHAEGGLLGPNTRVLIAKVINDLYAVWRSEFTQGETRRKRFRKLVYEHYEGGKHDLEEQAWMSWCCVLGKWIKKKSATVAHIVPNAYRGTDLSYLFGETDTAISDPGNGLIMHTFLGEAFDNGHIVFVPHGPLDVSPMEWQVILLNKEMGDIAVEFGGVNFAAIDGRVLTFVNAQGNPVIARPKRRYLYFRYCLAILHWQKVGRETSLPRGDIWASPDQPTGYLRRSILKAMASEIGGKLPEDLIAAGTFRDTTPSTRIEILEKTAGSGLANRAMEYQEAAAARQDDRNVEERFTEEDDAEEEDNERRG